MSPTVRPSPIVRLLAALCVALLLAAACNPQVDDAPAPGAVEDDGPTMADGMDADMGGMADESIADEGMDATEDMGPQGMDATEGMDHQDMDGMGGMAMDDRAEITVLAEAEVEALPSEPLGWVGYRIDGGAEAGTHSWGPAFLYADEGTRAMEVDGTEVTLEAGESIFVPEGVEHTAADGSYWAFLLTDPDGSPAPGLGDATHELSSGPLEGLPAGPALLRFLVVDLPPQDGRTAVHTHPGPEFIYVAQGEIEYETGLEETTQLSVGDDAALPADTAVQKRNVSDDPARFWSWFVVDPDEPFSTEATFDRS
jgi:quercetin dioxygenase-like cupin family protein